MAANPLRFHPIGRICGTTGIMPLSQELAESLAALYLDRRSYHHDLCQGGCTCGFSTLVTGLVEALLPGFADYAASHGLEGRPFWPEDHPELFPARVPAASTA